MSPHEKRQQLVVFSLNSYSNGICSMRKGELIIVLVVGVLILILMEYAL